MRLDKFLCETAGFTRSEAKQAIKKGWISVNSTPVKNADMKVAEEADVVTLQGKPLSFAKFHYYLLHKPAGVITATEDKSQKTVLDLLGGIPTKNLFPVGRLDKDTEGLLLITDDGELSHKLLSPIKHVDKTYFCLLKKDISEADIKALSEGVDIGDEKPTMPASVKVLSNREVELTIREGRFHQVKRMMQAVGNEVLYLKRLSMGPLSLPDDLEKGCFRPLSDTEIAQLKQEKLL